jgi:hypothetical protein
LKDGSKEKRCCSERCYSAFDLFSVWLTMAYTFLSIPKYAALPPPNHIPWGTT